MLTESLILENLTTNLEFVETALPYVKRDYFAEQSDKVLFDVISAYHDKYNSCPSKEAVVIDLGKVSDLQDNVYTEILQKIDDWDGTGVESQQWLVDTAEEWCQDRSLYNALQTIIQISQNPDFDAKGLSKGDMPEILREALGVVFDSDIGHDYLEDALLRLKYYKNKEQKIPFDIDILNKITKGGVERKTLNLILGGTGVGKTIWFCHFATWYLMQNYNVLYLTMEIAEEKIAKRIDANLLDIEMDDLEDLDEDVFMRLIEAKKEKAAHGKLIIKEYPTGAAHVGHFRHLLTELRTKKHFTPDVIIVDYMGICASSRLKMGGAVNTYVLLGSIAQELRGLSMETNTAVWSGAQTTRSANVSSDLEIDDVGESFALTHIADFLLGILEDDVLVELGQQKGKQLKNRYGDKNKYRDFKVNVTKDNMRLSNAPYATTKTAVSTPAETGAFDETDQLPSESLPTEYSGFKF